VPLDVPAQFPQPGQKLVEHELPAGVRHHDEPYRALQRAFLFLLPEDRARYRGDLLPAHQINRLPAHADEAAREHQDTQSPGWPQSLPPGHTGEQKDQAHAAEVAKMNEARHSRVLRPRENEEVWQANEGEMKGDLEATGVGELGVKKEP